VAVFLSTRLIVGALVLSWSFFRSRVLPPIGTEYIPDDLQGFVRFLLNTQYNPTDVGTLGVYLTRLVDQAFHFTKSFLGVGILLGLLGVAHLWRKQRDIALSTLVFFVLDITVHTSYPSPNRIFYVTPAYFVFSIWIGYGLSFLLARARRKAPQALVITVSAALILGLLIWKLPVRLARSRSTQVTDFVTRSFEELPEGSVVVSAWRRFTPLLYHQTVYGQRPDLILIERQFQKRTYAFGPVTSWRDYVESLPESVPVFIDRADLVPPGLHVVQTLDGRWNQITFNGDSD
jgi:hypothetical protein